MNEILYWDGVVSTLNPDQFSATIEKLIQGEMHGLELEKLHHYNIYSVRINKSDRLLLTLHEYKGKSFLIVLEHVPNHDYHKARFLQAGVLAQFLETHKKPLETQIQKTHFTAIDALPIQQEASTTRKNKLQYRPVQYYKNHFLEWSEAQNDIVAHRLPMVIRGVPGSGKTGIALRLLLKHIHHHPHDKHRLLYVTKALKLADEMRSIFESTPDIEPHKHRVEFLSYQALALRLDPTLADKELVNNLYFYQFYRNLPKNQQSLEAKKLYQEFRFICTFANPDDFMQAESNQSIFKDEAHRATAIKFFKQYQNYCHQQKVVDLEFLTITSSERYELLISDETQDLSPAQIQTVCQLAACDQLCICEDANQRLHQIISTEPFLQTLLAKKELKPTYYNLTHSYRNPSAIRNVANVILHAKNEACGGVDTKSACVRTESDQNVQEGKVHWLDLRECQKSLSPWLNEIIATTDFAILVQNEEMRIEAITLFKTNEVYLVEEIKGAEFPYVITYRLLDNPSFKEINKRFASSTSYEINPHLPKSRYGEIENQPINELNELYTAVTRTQLELIIIDHEHHHNSQLTARIKKAIPRDENSSHPLPIQAASDEDLSQRAQQLLENSNTSQAHSVLERLRTRRDKIKKVAIEKKSTPEESLPKQMDKPLSPQKNTDVKLSPSDYVNQFMSTYTPNKMQALLRSPFFQKLFFELRTDAGLTLFQTMCKHADQLIPVLNAVTPDRENIYSQILVNCTFDILMEDQAIVLDALSRLNSGMIFITKLFSFNHQLAGQLTEDHLYKNKYPHHRRPRTIFSNLCSTDTGHCFLNRIIETLPWITEKFPGFHPHYHLEFKHLCKTSVGRLLIMHFLLNDLKHAPQLTAKEIFTSEIMHYLQRDLVGIKVLNLLLTALPDMVQSIKRSDLFTAAPGQLSAFSALCIPQQGVMLLHRIFSLNKTLLNEMEADDLFKKFTGHDASTRFSDFSQLIMLDTDLVLLKLIFTAHPNFYKKIRPSDLFQATTGMYATMPPIWYMLKSEENTQFLIEIFRQRPGLYQHFTGPLLNHYFTNCPDPNINHLSLFTRLICHPSGSQLLQTLFDRNPSLIQEITGETLCLRADLSNMNPSKSPSPLFILTRNNEGRELLKHLIKGHPKILTQITAQAFYLQFFNPDGEFPHNTSVFYNLVIHDLPTLETILHAAPHLYQKITPDVLFKPVKMRLQTIATHAAFDWLFGHKRSFKLIIEWLIHFPDFAKMISFEAFYSMKEYHSPTHTMYVSAFTAVSDDPIDGKIILKMLYELNPQLKPGSQVGRFFSEKRSAASAPECAAQVAITSGRELSPTSANDR